MTWRVEPAVMRQHLRMYLVLGSVDCPVDPTHVVQEALAGGATMVQFREKGHQALVGEPMIQLARQIQHQCRKAGVPFIVNDDVDLALQLNADGVHIGQDDECAADVRKRIGNRILGVSAHTIEEAERAIRHGADYLGIGPIYPTRSKDDARAVQGPEILRIMRESGIDLPMVGIGGITAERVDEVIGAGADGVAVISAVTRAESAREAVETIARSVERFFLRKHANH